ncbi:alpha/beta fold hydrolase [Flavobacteriaceae bacterium Ap0902]|nr:alpha/beta fold hydrolase [Flavobacteriaceae bacterium Ap0902]
MKSIAVKISLQNESKLEIPLSYETFGLPLGSAPIILVNHALTGNSRVTGEHGWWNHLIDEGKTIDTKNYTILAFNIPGNGYDHTLIEHYERFNIKTISDAFMQGLNALGIKAVDTIIGSSLGGAIAWQMCYDAPQRFKQFIAIATDYKTSNWVRAQSYLQDKILNNSSNPIQDARVHGMLLYRTPASLNSKFKETWDEEKKRYLITDWLDYHGNALEKRFQLKAYKLMNHLLSTITVCNDIKALSKIESDIHIIAVNTDLFFTAQRNLNTYQELKPIKPNTYYHEIKSIHGHDAFLIEYEQLNNILNPLFNHYAPFKK